MLAQCGGGDGSDGDGGDGDERERDGGVGGQRGEVSDAGGTGEGGGVDSLLRGLREQWNGSLGNDVAIGFSESEIGTGGEKRIRDDVACDGGSDEHNALAMYVGGKRGGEGFADGLIGKQSDGETGLLGSGSGGATDGGDGKRRKQMGQTEFQRARDESADGVGAGEDHPVEAGERVERGVQRGEVFRRSDGQDGNFDGDGSESAQAVAQFGGLMGRAGDEDATALNRAAHGCAAADEAGCASKSAAPSASSWSATTRPSATGSVPED